MTDTIARLKYDTSFAVAARENTDARAFAKQWSKTVMCKENRRNALYNHENDLEQSCTNENKWNTWQRHRETFLHEQKMWAQDENETKGCLELWPLPKLFFFFLVDHLDRRWTFGIFTDIGNQIDTLKKKHTKFWSRRLGFALLFYPIAKMCLWNCLWTLTALQIFLLRKRG